jgi:methylaspartate mutase epsilon subunit
MNFCWYEKESTVEQNLEMCQYIFRLAGYYADRGVTLDIDLDSMSVNMVFPLSLAIAGLIATALLVAEQGAKSVTPWAIILGYLPQDIASTHVIRKLMREYLDKFGYQDVKVPGVFAGQNPLFPYPQSEGWAWGFAMYTAVVTALSGAEGIAIRTIDEGAGIASKEAHYLTNMGAHWIFNVVREQKINIDVLEEVKTEEKITEMEVRAIFDKILELGNGDIAVGLVRGFDSGVLDYPFSSNIHTKGKLLGVRDAKGGARYLDFGDLPIPKEAKEFNQEKIAERERIEGRKMDWRVMLEDFWAFSKGRIRGGIWAP